MSNNNQKDLILTLQYSDKNISIEPYESSEFQDYQENANSVCWNCCHDFDNLPIFIPNKYVNNIFYVSGCFCSFECCKRYIVENYNSTEMWEKMSLLHLFKTISTSDSQIILAPNKKSLKMFGGKYTIEEYRKNNVENHDIILPPIVPITDFEYTFESITKNIKNTNNFRLSRKKPVKNTNNIYDTMNLK
jgi:hypothetical protein